MIITDSDLKEMKDCREELNIIATILEKNRDRHYEIVGNRNYTSQTFEETMIDKIDRDELTYIREKINEETVCFEEIVKQLSAAKTAIHIAISEIDSIQYNNSHMSFNNRMNNLLADFTKDSGKLLIKYGDPDNPRAKKEFEELKKKLIDKLLAIFSDERKNAFTDGQTAANTVLNTAQKN